MQVKCEYCDNYIDGTAEQCPYCGAPNINKVRAANRIPRTIPELQAFCAEHNLDLERMHFHIGEDYRGPKAFGIYEENGRYIVYKNKSDGSRAIRYQGTDEAYAVNEIYQKMKAELNEVREIMGTKGTRRSTSTRTKSAGNSLGSKITAVIAALVIGWPFLFGACAALYGLVNPSPDRGYYQYDGDTYYYGHQGWYVYDDGADEWTYSGEPSFDGSASDYWLSSDYDDSYDAPSFSTSDYWDSDNNWDDDWDDDDWDWGSGSDYDSSDWDSGWDSWDSGNDWDSDW